MNHRARPIKYQSSRDYIAVSFASRTMRWTGIIIGLYLLFHLADLTWGFANPDFVRGAAYDNLVASFERWPVAIIYIAANIALGIHLFHGGWSMFQSLGLNSPRYNGARRVFAAGFAVHRRRHQLPVPDRRARRHRRLTSHVHLRPDLSRPPTTTRSPTVALTLDSKVPDGPLADKWNNHKFDLKLVNPSNRRKFDVIVVGIRPGRRRRGRHRSVRPGTT